jgi:hypothetical protein
VFQLKKTGIKRRELHIDKKEKDQENILDPQVFQHLEFLRDLGFIIPELLVGTWIKCAGEGKPVPSGSYCYVTRANELRNGGIGLVTTAMKHGEKFTYRTLPKTGSISFGLSPFSVNPVVVHSHKEEEKQQQQTKAELKRVNFLWHKASQQGRSLYLERNGVTPCEGLRFSETQKHGRSLVVPLYDSAHVLKGLQFIQDDGSKRIIGCLSGNAFKIGKSQSGLPIAICEGLSTGLCLHRLLNVQVICALSSSNLSQVASIVGKACPNATILVCGDNDRHLARNEGALAAQRAAGLVGGLLAIPDFGNIPAGKDATDWLDLVRIAGKDGALKQIETLYRQHEKR